MRRFRTLALCALFAPCLLPGVDASPQIVEVSKTDRMDFPANGTLRVQDSTGELTLEGWDQSGIEISPPSPSPLLPPLPRSPAKKLALPPSARR